MGRTRILVLGGSGVAALALALVVRGMAGGGDERPTDVAVTVSAPAAQTAQVLVAKQDLPAGHRIVAADLEWRPWPVEAVNASFITDGSVAIPTAPAVTAAAADGAVPQGEAKVEKTANTSAPNGVVKAAGGVAGAAHAMIAGPGPAIESLEGSVVRETILANEPISARKIVRAGDSGYMAVVLQPGMRAMAVPVSVETAAGGFILPGDRVDVILSRQVEVRAEAGSRSEFVTRTALRNIRVLAVDQAIAAQKDAQTVVGATATLEVSSSDAEALALAQAQGDLALVLRSYADADGPSGATGLVGGGGPTTGASSAGAGRSVRVWRYGQATDVAVN